MKNSGKAIVILMIAMLFISVHWLLYGNRNNEPESTYTEKEEETVIDDQKPESDDTAESDMTDEDYITGIIDMTGKSDMNGKAGWAKREIKRLLETAEEQDCFDENGYPKFYPEGTFYAYSIDDFNSDGIDDLWEFSYSIFNEPEDDAVYSINLFVGSDPDAADLASTKRYNSGSSLLRKGFDFGSLTFYDNGVFTENWNDGNTQFMQLTALQEEGLDSNDNYKIGGTLSRDRYKQISIDYGIDNEYSNPSSFLFEISSGGEITVSGVYGGQTTSPVNITDNEYKQLVEEFIGDANEIHPELRDFAADRDTIKAF